MSPIINLLHLRHQIRSTLLFRIPYLGFWINF